MFLSFDKISLYEDNITSVCKCGRTFPSISYPSQVCLLCIWLHQFANERWTHRIELENLLPTQFGFFRRDDCVGKTIFCCSTILSLSLLHLWMINNNVSFRSSMSITSLNMSQSIWIKSPIRHNNGAYFISSLSPNGSIEDVSIIGRQGCRHGGYICITPMVSS